ncbi:MAG: prepilin-type N-terminal cleavage/methylation domain-containing protein [Verrucomicrobiota bacterium]
MNTEIQKQLPRRSSLAFTLIELLTVISIIVVLMVIAVPAFNAIKGGGDTTKAGNDIAGALEMAKSYAIAKNTYVWVGFFEEDATSTTAGKEGKGRLVISMVASNDSTNQLLNGTLTNSTASQVYKLLKIDGVSLATLSSSDITRTTDTIPNANYQVAEDSFKSPKTFPFPLNGTAQYNFCKIIQFSPLGDATRFSDTPTPWMELGFRPTHGTATDTNSKNVVAIQIAGIGGQAIIQRP